MSLAIHMGLCGLQIHLFESDHKIHIENTKRQTDRQTNMVEKTIQHRETQRLRTT